MQSILTFLKSEDPTRVSSEEVESAIAFLLSLSNNDSLVSELVKAYYPFMSFNTDTGEVYFDSLLLSEFEKPQTASFMVSDAIAELVKSHEDERDKQIIRCKSIVSDPGLETIQISGLVNNHRIPQFLRNAIQVESTKPSLFKPQLTQKRLKSMKEKISIKEEERQALLEDIKHAKESIQAFRIIVEKENKENLESYINDSGKRLNELEKTNKKNLEKVEKGLKKNCKDVNKDYDSKINEIIEEIEQIQNIQKELEGGGWEMRKRRLENELKIRQLSRQVENIGKKRAKELTIIEETAEKTKQNILTHMLEEEAKEKQLIEELEKNGKDSLEKIKEINNLLENLEDKVKEEQEYLANLLNLKYKDGEHIYVPFYIHKSDNVYGYLTPTRIEESGGVKKTLKVIFAENLREKILENVEPETESINVLMEKLIKELSEESKLSREYKKKIGEKNRLTSRDMLDKIEVGLYKLFEWEWINEKDYMIAQKSLVEKMDTLNGGNLFQREIEPLTDTPLQLEVPA